MANCLGPNLKEQILPQILGGVGKLILGLLLTWFFLTLFAAGTYHDFLDSSLLACAIILLIISPIWFGCYSLFSLIIDSQQYWWLNLIVSSVSSAALAVWVLPGFIFAVFIIIFGFLEHAS